MEIKRYTRPKLPRNKYVTSAGTTNIIGSSSSTTVGGEGQLTEEQLQFIYNLMNVLTIDTQYGTPELIVNTDLTMNTGNTITANDVMASGDVIVEGGVRAGDEVTAFFSAE